MVTMYREKYFEWYSDLRHFVKSKKIRLYDADFIDETGYWRLRW